MKTKVFLLTVVAVLTFAVAGLGQKAAAGQSNTDLGKPVKDAFERLVEGIRQVDAAKVMSVYEKGDRTLFFNNNGSVTMGWQTMKDNRDASYARTKNVSLEITGLRVEMLGPKSAYVSCKWKQSQEYDGKLESASGRMTLIFRLNGKDWKVAHLHTSPDNPGPSRPVLDSERIKEN